MAEIGDIGPSNLPDPWPAKHVIVCPFHELAALLEKIVIVVENLVS